MYHPCLLVAKKRYVGLKFETPDDTTPELDAKGLEVVRRDGCPLMVRTMNATIRLLFDKDLSRLRRYLESVWSSMMNGSMPINSYIFACEVRAGTYRAPHGNLPPAAQIAEERVQRGDPRAWPLYGDRVPYLMVSRTLLGKLKNEIVPPDLIFDPTTNLRVNVHRYIVKKLLPSLERLSKLAHVDIYPGVVPADAAPCLVPSVDGRRREGTIEKWVRPHPMLPSLRNADVVGRHVLRVVRRGAGCTARHDTNERRAESPPAGSRRDAANVLAFNWHPPSATAWIARRGSSRRDCVKYWAMASGRSSLGETP